MEPNKNNGQLKTHLASRHFDLETHTAWLDDTLATFPLWNLSGQLVGYQHYRPGASKEPNNDAREGRYFTRLPRSRVGVWGLESWRFSDTLFLCEGVFDACKVTWLGFSAIAVFSNDISFTTASWLNVVRASRKVVALCDGDKVGLNLAIYAHIYHQINPWHDVGEAPLDHVYELCNELGE